jgi:hypothetical protein
VYGVLLGVCVVILFDRIARLEEEPPVPWGLAAGVAYFVPSLWLGTLWGIGGTLLLGGAFCVRVMTRGSRGGEPIR